MIHKYIIIILLLLIIYFLIYNNTTEQFKTEEPPKITESDVVFPFKKIYDQNMKFSKLISISAPFRETKHQTILDELKKQGYQFIIISSYCEFPSKISNPIGINDIYDDREKYGKYIYDDMAIACLHCFRNPDNYIKPGIPRLLLSESDFTEPNQLIPNPKYKKSYDVLYVCLDDSDDMTCVEGWQAHNRNWELGKKCIKIMCEAFHLRVLIFGRNGCKLAPKCSKFVKTKPFTPYHKFLKYLQKSKMLFVPNIADASPRVATQAMCLNVPVLMNKNIVGGWKYINDKTGEFFTDENDFSNVMTKMLNKQYEPRKYFEENYGIKKSGEKLLEFVKEHYKDLNLNGVEHLRF